MVCESRVYTGMIKYVGCQKHDISNFKFGSSCAHTAHMPNYHTTVKGGGGGPRKIFLEDQI